METEQKITYSNKKLKIFTGVIYINSTFNNTIITITDLKGNTLLSSSSGKVGFTGSRKSTNFAAQKIADILLLDALRLGIKKVYIFLKGVGIGRETIVHAIYKKKIKVEFIKDNTPLAHNGCRLPLKRRI